MGVKGPVPGRERRRLEQFTLGKASVTRMGEWGWGGNIGKPDVDKVLEYDGEGGESRLLPTEFLFMDCHAEEEEQFEEGI